MSLRLYAILIMLFSAFSAMSCVVDHSIGPVPVPSRVLLAYVGVDNNLCGLEQEKIDGLRAGWSGGRHDRILAFVDRSDVGASLYDLSSSSGSEPSVVATYGRQNSASPEVFARVIADVLEQYPADTYNLLIFSHASGWLPQGALTNPYNAAGTRSVMVDGANEMALTDFAAAIPDGVFRSITFEACFMAGIEVAYELRHKADYILASSAEIIHPGFAPTYSTATTHLLDGDVRRFGQRVFDHTLTYAETSLQHSATYSVIRTAGLDALAAFVRQECHFGLAVDVARVQHFDRYAYRLFFDFEDYYGRLLPNDYKRSELARLIGECVTWKSATPQFMTQQSGYNGFAITRHSGLTTYIPQSQFSGLNAAHGKLGWSRAILPGD